jgi:hypothetical protein
MEESIKKRFDFIEQELDIRIESLKEHLNTQKHDLFKKIDKFSTRLKIRISKKAKELKKLDLFVRKCGLVKYKLSKNDNWIDASFIGFFNKPIEGLGNNDFIKISTDIKFITSLCALNNQCILMSDDVFKELWLVDSNLKRITRVSDQFGIKQAKGVCIDLKKNIYICDVSNRRVVIFDYSLKNILGILVEFDSNENPNEVFVFDERVYIICDNSRDKLHIKIFVNNRFCESLFQKESYELKKIKMSKNYIYCTDYEYNFYVFTHAGSLIKSIEKFGLGLASYLEVNGLFITLHKFGFVNFYDLDESIGKSNELIDKICKKLNSNCTPLGFWLLQNKLYIFLQWNELVNFNPHVILLDLQ